MAIDGTPPRRLPAGARWLALSLSDLPFTVPAGFRFVICSVLISYIENNFTNTTRELFSTVGWENNPALGGAVPFGIAAPAAPAGGPVHTGLSTSNLAIPAIGAISKPPFPNQLDEVMLVQGYLEAR